MCEKQEGRFTARRWLTRCVVAAGIVAFLGASAAPAQQEKEKVSKDAVEKVVAD